MTWLRKFPTMARGQRLAALACIGGVTTVPVVTLPVMIASFYAVHVQHSTIVPADDEVTLARRVIDAAPGRDLRAEEELYRRLAPRARLYGLKHLRDPQSAADLAQDVMLMTLDRLQRGEVREPERITSFVLGTCRQ